MARTCPDLSGWNIHDNHSPPDNPELSGSGQVVCQNCLVVDVS